MNEDELRETYKEILETCATGLYKTKAITREQLEEFFKMDFDDRVTFCQEQSEKWLTAVRDGLRSARNN